MKTTLVSLIALSGLLAFSSCRKEKPGQPGPVYPDYAALKPGNYWIYQRYETDPDGAIRELNEFDSAYVEKDTLIHGQTYHKYVTRGVDDPYSSYLQDSLHYLVDEKGKIQFSSEDFTSVFWEYVDIDSGTKDTLYKNEVQMKDKDFPVTTLAGSFYTSDFCTTIYMYPPYDKYGKIRYNHRRYAKGIGVVEETVATWLSSGRQTCRRLVRYRVQ
jgi:hypothetical protein